MKYGIWNVSQVDGAQREALLRRGCGPLTASVLCARGCDEELTAELLGERVQTLHDPFLLRDMEKAVLRVREALNRREKIAVFGDYDVDGITATCLLTEFLQSQGGQVTTYIPGRLEEGYGLSCPAIDSLFDQGVTLIITVDCGITAQEEALHCRELGVDLIITDHHECKEQLPQAAAVVDPHRRDHTYCHQSLAGVGVAFKLAAAIAGSQEAILDRFSDLLCLGTVADVMPLLGENRVFVRHGLAAMTEHPRPGVAALIRECGCDRRELTASLVGYSLAPRINAAGRMGQVELAVELFLTQDQEKAQDLARQLFALNRRRQEVEAEIYDQAVELLEARGPSSAIVLAKEGWHQGVVGIVASRLAEEYACPTYLICLDGERGKASSRSYGGFNLFQSLEKLSPMLESYGGHELAAGFTITRNQIESFRREIEAMAQEYAQGTVQGAVLECDCAVEPWMLTQEAVEDLQRLEPVGAGCPKPVFVMDRLQVEQAADVGSGRHLRLRLGRDGQSFPCIFFATNLQRTGVAPGDWVEAAFTPQINEFRGFRSVQLNMVDLRPDFSQDQSLYDRFASGAPLEPREAAALLPDRQTFAALWRLLRAQAVDGCAQAQLEELCRQVAQATGRTCPAGRLRVCLAVFQERGLLHCRNQAGLLAIRLCRQESKVDLTQSPILQNLTQQKGGA